jgi:ubiquinol-cytochrome c reductase cytochrome c1 subunit
MMKKLPAILLLACGALLGAAFSTSAAASGAKVHLDHAPVNLHDKISLQRGAQVFVNHCLNCHSATMMRYGRLTDLGLTEDQIRDNLILSGDKIGDAMATALTVKDGKAWFGVLPPDLSLVARSRGPDWLYTYLRGFYRDSSTKSGWNNVVFPNVGMPHVLWEYQGDQFMQVTERVDPVSGEKKETHKLVLDRPGKLTAIAYDEYVGDLVNFLVYMGEPARASRTQIGILVLFFLAAFFMIVLALKKEYWKDVH